MNTEIIELLIDALEYYANTGNWLDTYKAHRPTYRICNNIDSEVIDGSVYSGKIARDTLAIIADMEQDK